MVEYGEKNSNNRSTVFGHWVNSWGYLVTGNFEAAQKCCEKAIDVALDPFYG
jgi:hypothetical protein